MGHISSDSRHLPAVWICYRGIFLRDIAVNGFSGIVIFSDPNFHPIIFYP